LLYGNAIFRERFVFEIYSFFHDSRALCKLVDTRPEKWDEYLDAVMFGLRTKTQLTTRFSPFFLMFGMEARYPCEVPETYEVCDFF